MLDKIKSLFGASADGGATAKSSTHEEHHIAAAVLLVEAARLDGVFEDIERQTIADLLAKGLELDPTEVAKLIDVAVAQHDDAVEIFRFTNQVKEAFDETQRIQMIEMLWEVVYSDNVLHDYEANLLRRVAGLLHVPDRQSGEARKRVRAKLGLDNA